MKTKSNLFLALALAAANADASVTPHALDLTTGPNWRTGASGETDSQYGTDGYVLFGIGLPDGSFTGSNYNIAAANTNNTYVLPGYATLAAGAGNTYAMWSGNGNFGQMQNPAAGNALTSTPALLRGSHPNAADTQFVITRTTTQAFRLTVLMGVSSDGGYANNTYNLSVNAGAAGVASGNTATAPAGGQAGTPGMMYMSFDIGAGSDPITVTLGSGSGAKNLAGLAFDAYVAPPLGPALTWVGASTAWDTATTGNWKRTSDNSAAVFANSPPNPVLFDDTAANRTVDISAGNVTPAGTVIDTTAGYTLQGTGGIGGSYGLTKSGTGTLTLGNPNTYIGSTTIDDGTLQLTGTGSLGGGTYGGLVTNNGTFAHLGNGTQTLSGVISGSGTVVQGGTGTLRLGAPNTYTGNVLVSSGTLTALTSMSSSAATSFGNLTVPGKTITVSSGATLVHGTNDLYFNGAANFNTSLATIILDGGAMNTGSYYSAIKSLEIRSGAAISGTNGVVNAFRSLALTGTVTCTGGTGAVSTMSAPGATGGIHLGHSAFGVSGTTFNVDAASGGLDIAGPLVNQSNSMAAGSLVKTGDGTLTLSGTGSHSYTGTTTVNGGTLAVTGTLGIASAEVAVNGTATLTGNGTINRPVSINSGAFLTPGGPAIDTLFVGGALTLAPGSKTTCQIDKTGGVPTQDLLDTLSVAYGGTLEVTATGDPLALGDSFKLFNATTYSGAFSSTLLPALPGGLQWDLSTLITDGTITVVNTAAAPVFNPSAGGYVGALAVTMTSTPGTTIRYTTDGTDPKFSGTAVTGASPLVANIPTDTETVTLTAYASQAGYGDSTNQSATFSTITTPTWNMDDNGDWSDTTKWKFGVVPNGAGITADFNTMPQNADTTITLDGNRTLGSLVVGNPNPFNWSLTGSGGSVLTLAAGGAPGINITSQTATIGVPVAGTQGFVKTGAGTLRLTSPASSYSGDIVISGGSVVATGNTGGVNPATGSLGHPGVARSITVGNGGSLSFGAHDILGNHNSTVAATLVIYSGGAVTNEGNFFTTLGPVTMAGGTLHAVGGANATFPAFSFKGTVTALDGTSSVISGTGTNAAYHLGDSLVLGTTFDVQGTGSLTISGELRDGRDPGYPAHPSALTKAGPGTLILAGINTYTGNTAVNAGSLVLADNARLQFVIGNASGTNNQLGGSGTVTLDGDFAIDVTAAAALGSGTWLLENVASLGGAYGPNFSVVDPDGTPWTDAGSDKWTKDAGAGKRWSFDETTGTLTLGAAGGFDSWASENGVTGGPNGDSDHDGIVNLVEYALNLNPAGSDGSAGTLSGNLLSFTKRALAVTNGDVSYAIQESDDLGITDVWATVTPTTDNPTTISYALPTGAAKKFARLVITQTP